MKTWLALWVALAAGLARADGAFPDSFTLFAPVDQPSRLMLSTNFGLLVSEDEGASWYLVCELAMHAPNGFLYQLGPPPPDAVGVASPLGLSVSLDDACDWTVADGGVGQGYVEDFFFDPSSAARVLAVVSRPNLPDGGRLPMGIYQSSSGGATFDDAPWFTSSLDAGIQSVEISRSSPSTVYVTRFELPNRPLLDRSDDFGATWHTYDLSAQLASMPVRIAAVDPQDPSRVYLRAIDAFTGNDALAVATDGGASLAVPLRLPTAMSGFLRRSNGEVLVTTREYGSYRSADLGQTFQPWATDLHLRAVTERGDTLYLVGDNFQDKFAVASSPDDGATRHPLLVFNRICGLKSCGSIPATCQTAWANLQSTLVIPDNACAPVTPHGCHCAQLPAPLTALAALLALALRAQGRSRRSRVRR